MQLKPMPELAGPNLLKDLPEWVKPPEPEKFVAPKGNYTDGDRFYTLMKERQALGAKLGLGQYENKKTERRALAFDVNEHNLKDVKRFLELGGVASHAPVDRRGGDPAEWDPNFKLPEWRWENKSKRNKNVTDLLGMKVRSYELTQETAKMEYRAKMTQEFNNLKSGLSDSVDRDIVVGKRRGANSLNTSGSQGGLGIPV